MFDHELNEDVTWRIDNMDRWWRIYDNEPAPTFHFIKYKAPSKTWDHDHCCGCTIKFSETKFEGILNEGYANSNAVGESADWLCSDCYRLLNVYLKQSRVPSHRAPIGETKL